MVYTLYDLTEEEIKLIEGDSNENNDNLWDISRVCL